MVVTFSRPVVPADGELDNEVTVSSGLATSSIEGNELTIEIRNVPNASCVRVKLRGLVDTNGLPLDGPNEMCIGVLTGDVNGDGRINLSDLVAVRDRVNQTATESSFRSDVNGDNKVNLSDMVIIRGNVNMKVTCPPPPPGVLSVVDSDDFASLGFQGGPFIPNNKTYTVINTGGAPLDWTAAKARTWVTLSKTSGTLAAGAADAVEVSFNAEASSLLVGSYTDTVTFSNVTSASGDTTRAVSLTVVTPSSMVFIPAGEFLMGDSFGGEGYSGELPRHAVNVDAFYMDKYEVTNQQYADALNWAKGQGNLITVTGGVVYKYNSGTNYPYCDATSSSYSRITWNGSTFGVVSGKENHPMVQVSWYGAVAYANWRSAMQGRVLCYDLSSWECNFGSGYRLPTEAEWEKAARGGVADHRFPWSDSDDIQHARANYSSSSGYSYDNSPTRGYHPMFSSGDEPYTSPVGYFAANGYGLHDMAGNVWEWCNDWYGGSYYSSSPTNNPCGPSSGTYRVHRGGGWDHDANGCRVAYRIGYCYPVFRLSLLGFRLVLDAE